MSQPRGWHNAHLRALSALLKSTVRWARGRPFTAAAQQGKQIAEAASRKNTRWTIEQDRKLVELRESGMQLRDIAKHFPDRSPRSIPSRVRLIGLGATKDGTLVGKANSIVVRGRPYYGLADDDTRGALHQQHGGLAEKAEQQGTRALGSKAKEQHVRGRFTDAEDAQLSSLVEAGFTWRAIQEQMPQRSPRSLYSRWYQTSSNRPSRLWASNASSSAPKRSWSEAEILQLKRLHALGKRSDYIARALGRTYPATKWRIWHLSKLEGRENVPKAASDSIGPQIGPSRDHDTTPDKPLGDRHQSYTTTRCCKPCS